MFKLTNIAGVGGSRASQILDGYRLDERRLAIAMRNVQLAKQLISNGGLRVTVAAAAPKNDEDFGQRLTAAVKRLVAQRFSHPHSSATANCDDGFSQKLTEAVKAKVAFSSPSRRRQRSG